MNRIRRFLIALAVTATLLLGACGTKPQIVQVPVPVPCPVEYDPDRVFSDQRIPPGSDIFTQVKMLLAGRSERIDDRRQITAQVEACRS